jgi:peptidoglycan hydrolase CwlO-like protein
MGASIDDITPMTASVERLDRIEAILAALAEGQAAFNAGQQQIQAQLERTEAQIERTQAQLERTEAQAERTQAQLERTEAQVERTQVQLERTEVQVERTQIQMDSTQTRLERTQALVDSTLAIANSNARAVEAWATRIEEVAIDTEEATSSTRADLAVRIDDNAHNQGIDRVRFDQLHEEHSQRFETLLEEARADRVAWRQSLDEQLAEMRRDRDSNSAEHRAFTQNSQILLAEISRLWQRLAS